MTGSGDLVSTFLNGHRGRVNDLLLVNNRMLASASSDDTIIVWNITTQSRIFTLTQHNDTVRTLRLIAPNIMASASQDGQIILWNLTNGLPIASLNNHSSEIGYALGLIVSSMDAMSSILVSGGRDQWINLWNVSTGQLIRRFYTGKDVYALSLMVKNCGERNLW